MKPRHTGLTRGQISLSPQLQPRGNVLQMWLEIKWASNPFVPLSICFCLNLLLPLVGSHGWRGTMALFLTAQAPVLTWTHQSLTHERNPNPDRTSEPTTWFSEKGHLQKTPVTSLKWSPSLLLIATSPVCHYLERRECSVVNRSTVPTFFDTLSDKQTTVHLKCRFKKKSNSPTVTSTYLTPCCSYHTILVQYSYGSTS